MGFMGGMIVGGKIRTYGGLRTFEVMTVRREQARSSADSVFETVGASSAYSEMLIFFVFLFILFCFCVVSTLRNGEFLFISTLTLEWSNRVKYSGS